MEWVVLRHIEMAMKSRSVSILLLGLALALPGTRAAEDPAKFVAALKEAGYHDMVAAYLERRLQQRQDPELLFELGKALVDWAAHEVDLGRRAELLQRAETTLRRYRQDNPDGLYVANAAYELARLLYERGRLAAAKAAREADPAKAEPLRQEAQRLLAEARQAFQDAAQRFRHRLSQFPPYIDPKRPVVINGRRIPGRQAIQLRRQAQIDTVLARFHAAMCLFEAAQNLATNEGNRADRVREALREFEAIYQEQRTLLVGLHARFWMARCYEELGDLRRAVGLYDELLRHDPAEQPNRTARLALQDLQRRVRVHWIAIQNRIGNYELAYEAAREWLTRHGRASESELADRVRWELATAAKELAQRLPEGSRERRRLMREAIAAWTELARPESAYRPLATTELHRWAADRATTSRDRPVDFRSAVALAEEALERQNWEEAARLFEQALRHARNAPDPYQLNNARLRWSYALYQSGRRLEAAVLAEYVAFVDPSSSLAKPAAHIALVALWQAASDYGESLRQRAAEIAEAIVTHWPNSVEADFAHSVLGSMAWSEKRWAEAARHYAAVSPRADNFIAAQLRAAEAWWNSYVYDGKTDQSLRQTERAATRVIERLRDQGTNPMPSNRPVEWVRADLILARVEIERGQLEQAAARLEPYFTVLFTRDELEPVRQPLLMEMLRVYLLRKDVDGAQRILALLDETGQTKGLKGLLVALALQLAEQGDQTGVEALEALARRIAEEASEADVPVLQQLVAALETANAYSSARALAEKLVELTPTGTAAHRAARLLLARTLRKERRYPEAATILYGGGGRTGLLAENPRALDAIMEYGRILTWWATEENKRWKQAVAHWNRYARLLGFARRKPPEHDVAWAFLAISSLGLAKSTGQATDAQRTRALVQYLRRTLPPTTLQQPLPQPDWNELLTLARTLGINTDGVTKLGELLERIHEAAGSLR